MRKRLWKFDEQAINEAAQMMGLKFPVKVRGKRGRYSTTTGLYKGIQTFNTSAHTFQSYAAPTHEIDVATWIGEEKATAALFHELCHARQCEDFINAREDGNWQAGQRDCDAAYDAEGGTYRGSAKAQRLYKQNKYEVEADNYEQCAEYMSLVKTTKYGRERQERLEQRKLSN